MTELRQTSILIEDLGPKYTVGTLASLTGLSQHTIRAWERRYQALSPGRTETNRRLYDDHDVERLRLLMRSLRFGHRIGQVAKLSTDQLRRLALSTTQTPASFDRNLASEGSAPYLAAAIAALGELNPDALEDALIRGSAAMGLLGLLDGVVIPLLAEVQQRWDAGTLSISQEHLGSAVLRTFLDRARMSMPAPPGSPRLLVTTPRKQHHEIGALIVAIVAALQSWSVTYLGPNLPAAEIAAAAKKMGAAAIGLSLVYPTDDRSLDEELKLLRRSVGPEMPIIVGGRAVGAYAETLLAIDARVSQDLATFGEILIRVSETLPGSS